MHKERFIYTLFLNCTSIQSNVAFNRLYILEVRVELTMNHTCKWWLYIPFIFDGFQSSVPCNSSFR